MEYEFTLKLATKGADLGELVERLGEAGCTDALPGVGQPGHLALAFSRESESAHQAIKSAIQEVRVVLPETILVAFTPDGL